MPLITPQRRVETITISLRIEKPLLEELDAYCNTIASDRTYVIGEMIRAVLARDYHPTKPATARKAAAV